MKTQQSVLVVAFFVAFIASVPMAKAKEGGKFVRWTTINRAEHISKQPVSADAKHVHPTSFRVVKPTTQDWRTIGRNELSQPSSSKVTSRRKPLPTATYQPVYRESKVRVVVRPISPQR